MLIHVGSKMRAAGKAKGHVIHALVTYPHLYACRIKDVFMLGWHKNGSSMMGVRHFLPGAKKSQFVMNIKWKYPIFIVLLVFSHFKIKKHQVMKRLKRRVSFETLPTACCGPSSRGSTLRDFSLTMSKDQRGILMKPRCYDSIVISGGLPLVICDGPTTT